MAPTLEATTVTTVQVKPALRTKLLKELRLYHGLTKQLKALEAQVDQHKTAIAEIRELTGEDKLEIDGYSITLVAPMRKVFDAKRFVTLGGDLDLYNRANVDTPSKAYTKVTVPKDVE